MRPAILTCLLIGAAIPACADQWAFFHPEAVRSRTCKVAPAQLSEAGGPVREVFEAYGVATREGMADWGQTVGEFPQTDKGMDQALDACKAWMKETSKRIRKAQKAEKQ